MEAQPYGLCDERFIRTMVNGFIECAVLVRIDFTISRLHVSTSVHRRHFCTLMTLTISVTSAKCVITTQVLLPNNVQTSEMSP